MKVLFAVNNDKIAESIIRKYQEEYKEIISSKTVYYFNAIIKELQKDKSYDRIVISEDLEMFSNDNYQAIDKFIFEKMDAISDEATNIEGNDVPIIFLCTDRRTKNDPLLARLFGLGIYGVLVGQDRSIQKVCGLLYKPRSKKEAKQYYKVDAENVSYIPESNDFGVSESEIQNIVYHYKKIGNNVPKCVKSFDSIYSQYSEDQVRLIVNVLPVSSRLILEENSDTYRKLMGIKGKRASAITKNEDKEYVEQSIVSGSKLTKPIIIPTQVNTKNVVKIEDSEEEMRKKAELKRKEEERMAREKAAAEAKRKDEERKAKEKAAAEAKRKEEERIAKEKAAAEAKRKEEERKAKEKAAAEAKKKEEERKAKENKMKNETENIQPVKRGRGRPRKNPVEEIAQVATAVQEVAVKRGRGRPRKNPIEVEITKPIEEKKEKSSSKNKKEKVENNIVSKDLLLDFDDFEEETPVVKEKYVETDNKAANTIKNLTEEDFDEIDFDDFDSEDNDELELNNNENVEYKDENITDSIDNDFEEDDYFDDDDLDDLDDDDFDDLEDDYFDDDDLDLPEEDDEDKGFDLLEDNEDNNNNEDDELPDFEDDEDDDEDDLILPEETDDDDSNNIIIPPQAPNIKLDGLSDEEYDEDDDDFFDIDDDTDVSNEKNANNSFNGISNKNYKYDDNLANSIKDLQETEENQQSYNAEIDNLITSNQKVVAFVGTSKNGTSFMVNNLADVLSNRGIKTAILDLTKNKNAFYTYTNNEENLRKIAYNCLEKLKNGSAEGIDVNKNLSVFTCLPGEDSVLDNATNIIQTLIDNYTVVLLDCDFETRDKYFKVAQEIYLVQTLDVLTIQPLTAFLRDLKVKGILNPAKLRIVINKNIKVSSITERMLIDGMSSYNDPGMTYMTELFNSDNIKYATIPFDNQVYIRYLEGLISCKISTSKYPKYFLSNLNKLADVVYPVLNGKKDKNYNDYSKKNKKTENAFSDDTKSTLDKMKKKY